MFRNVSRLCFVCLLALLAWFGTLFWGRVWAGWFPPRPTLGMSGFVVSEQATHEGFVVVMPLESTSPDCPNPTATISWTEPSTSARVEGSALFWTTAAQTVDFEISSDCSFSSELVVSAGWQSDLPWGVAQSESNATLTQSAWHIFPGNTQRTKVKWFVPNAETSYSLALREPVVQESASPIPVQPLISHWWQGGNTTPCHDTLSILLPTVPCITGWWQRFSDPLLSPDFVPALPEPGQIIISEVNWAGSFLGSTNTSSDEWLELTNLSPEAISLQGLEILGARSSGQTLIIDQPLVLAPYAVAVISRLPAAQTQVQISPDWTTSQLVLSNTEAQLILQLPDGTELDRTPPGPWQVGKNSTGTTPLRASAQRSPATIGQGADWDSWQDCADTTEEWCRTLSGRAYKAGTANTWGTPGMTWP